MSMFGRELGEVVARLRGRLSHLARDRRGVAAVEFAFIAPLLLCMYFVTMEVAQGIETNKKVSRVGSMVGDLVTQQQSTTKTEIDAIMAIGEALLEPYGRSNPEIIITAIEITDEASPKVKVVWSRKLKDGVASAGAAAGTATSVPASLKIRNSFLIRTESRLEYEPVITWAAESKQPLGLASAFDGISMGETYYHRPRMSHSIPCSNC